MNKYFLKIATYTLKVYCITNYANSPNKKDNIGLEPMK